MPIGLDPNPDLEPQPHLAVFSPPVHKAATHLWEFEGCSSIPDRAQAVKRARRGLIERHWAT